MNYMKQVAQMLGVELEKEFKLNDDYHKYKLNDKGLVMYECGEWTVQSLTFTKLLNGQYEIIKLSKPILDDTEKKDISGVIEPFRRYFKYIKKCELYGKERIVINIKKECDYDWLIELPPFKKGTMYKGMKSGKEYTLEELNI